MSCKAFAQVSVLALFLLGFFVAPVSVQAGGLCGGTYIVSQGETVETIAATCGTTTSAITAANPGIGGSLYVGQSLFVPGPGNTVPIPPVPPTNPPPSNPPPVPNPVSYTSTYIVRYGDTFSGIARRFGVSIYDLWAANSFIWDINLIYVGQVLRVPTSSPVVNVPQQPSQPLAELSYGTVPAGTPHANVRLSNQANAEVYVSLQGTTREGFNVINEYPVSGTRDVRVPAGWYVYVAWVGGQKFVGQFNLPGGADVTITFRSNKVIVE